jgi:2Fe-2S ferredoxin
MAGVRVRYVDIDGAHDDIEAEPGDSVMRSAVQNGLPGIVGECGGTLSCASCHVYVEQEWMARVGGPDATESDLLEGVLSPRRPESRLSCQIRLTAELDGLVVHLPEEQL